MSRELCPERPLFGGAISSAFPQRFEDVSEIRQVPDHQEVFVDPSRDDSLIFELLDYKPDVADIASASWFLHDLAREQDAQGFTLTEQSGVIELPGLLSFRNIPTVATTAVAQMSISKGRQGREAQNLVRVYVANIRLKGAATDVLVTVRKVKTQDLFTQSSQYLVLSGVGMESYNCSLESRRSTRSLQEKNAKEPISTLDLAHLAQWFNLLVWMVNNTTVTAYEPIHINPLSQSANAVAAGLAVPASQSGVLPMCDVIKHSLSTFKVNDWGLFGSLD